MKDDNYFYSVLLFLVWPLLALVSAFKNYKSAWAKNILWAFVAFYGFTFAIGAESEGTDILKYINEYRTLHESSLSISSALDYYTNSGEIDVLRTFLAVVLSRFTDNPSVLTLVYGIIFGFFFSRNMWYVLERLEGKIQIITILLFVSYFLVIPIWNINGFRFWTASHVFIYGLLSYLFEGKNKGIFVASLSILVHFSFLVPVSVLLAYIVLGNRLVIYFVFFLSTFFITEINLEAFNTIVESYTPEILQERTAGYRSEEYVETFREGPTRQRNWYVYWHSRALSWSVMGFLVIFFFKGREFFLQNKKWKSLFSFTLLFFGAANLLNSIPSAGRFVDVALLCSLALIILYVQNREHEVVLRRFILVASPALLLFIIVTIRIGLLSMSATTFLGNPIIALFLTGENISLNDLLRSFL